MTLNFFDPNNMLTEITRAVETRDKHLESSEDQIGEYTGPFWKGDDRRGDYSPESIEYQYVALMLPRLVYDNPRVNVSSRRPGKAREVAEAMGHGLNRLVRDQQLRKTLQSVILDMLFHWGVIVVSEQQRDGILMTQEDDGYTATPSWPVASRISPHKFFMDAGALRRDECRFQGHELSIDKSDLLKRAKKNPQEKWDVEVIKGLAEDEDDKWHEMRGYDIPARGRIRIYQAWVPEIQLEGEPGPEKGFYGTMFTLGVSQPTTATASLYDASGEVIPKEVPKHGFLRPPKPYYGPRWGPYVMFSCYEVNDSPFPLGPLTATRHQIHELNTHVKAAARSMAKHKRIIACSDNDTAEKIKKTHNDYVVVIPPALDGKPKAMEMNFAGMSDDQTEWIFASRNRVERALGMDDTMTGSVEGRGTATEHAIASESSTTRIAGIKQQVADSTEQVLRSEAFYMFHSDNVVFPMGGKVAEELEMEEPWFKGGIEDPESGYSFDDLELEIDPYSLERSDEGLKQRRAQEFGTQMLNSIELMATFPSFRWREFWKWQADAQNVQQIDKLFPAEMLEQLGGDMRESMEDENRLGKDVGQRG